MEAAERRDTSQTLLISAVTEKLFVGRLEHLLRDECLDPRKVSCVVPQIYKREYRELGLVVPLPASRYQSDLRLPELEGRHYGRVIVLFENNIFRFENVIEFARCISRGGVSLFDLASGRRSSPGDSALSRVRFQSGNSLAWMREKLPGISLAILRFLMPPLIGTRRLLNRALAREDGAACPLCASSHTRERYAFDEKYRIHDCGECSLKFQTPHPSAEELASHFTAYGTYLEPEVSAQTYRNGSAPRFPAILEAAASRPGLRILEIGCGNGAYLYNLKRRYPQMEVVGQEIDPVNGRFARENSGCEVWVGNIAKLELPPDYFDFVVATQVLEHIPIGELKRVLPAISGTLKVGGRFIGDLPNFDSLPHTWLEGRWKNVGPLDHNSMLTSRSLGRLFREYGEFSNHLIETSRTVNVAQIVLNLLGKRDPKFTGMSRWQCKVGLEEGANLLFSATR